MTEERKHAILFAATLLSARRLIENIESSKPKLNEQYLVDEAIKKAAFVLERIDLRSRVIADRCVIRRFGRYTLA